MPDPHAPTDHAITSAIAAGDRVAFDTLYLQWFEQLWHFAQRYVGPAIAEDVMQDVFFAIWQQRTQWHVHTTLRAYLYGAVRNRALHHIAHQDVVNRTVSQILEDAESRTVDHPLARITSDEVDATLANAVTTLPERQRAAIILRLQRDLSYSEIGEALGISATAAGNLVTKAITKLQNILGPLHES